MHNKSRPTLLIWLYLITTVLCCNSVPPENATETTSQTFHTDPTADNTNKANNTDHVNIAWSATNEPRASTRTRTGTRTRTTKPDLKNTDTPLNQHSLPNWLGATWNWLTGNGGTLRPTAKRSAKFNLVGVVAFVDSVVVYEPCCEDFPMVHAAFGPNPKDDKEAAGRLYFTESNEGLGCEGSVDSTELEEVYKNHIVAIRRGVCTFYEKVLVAQRANARGVIVYNNESGGLLRMGIDDDVEDEASEITIPSVFVSQSTGHNLNRTVVDFIDSQVEEGKDEDAIVHPFVAINGSVVDDFRGGDSLIWLIVTILFRIFLVFWTGIVLLGTIKVYLNSAKVTLRRKIVTNLPIQQYHAPTHAPARGNAQQDTDASDSGTTTTTATAKNGDDPMKTDTHAGGEKSLDAFAMAGTDSEHGAAFASASASASATVNSDNEAEKPRKQQRRQSAGSSFVVASSPKSSASSRRAATSPTTNTSNTNSQTEAGNTREGHEPHPLANFEMDSCVICLTEFEESEDVAVLPCQHIYHPDCVKQWLMDKSSCCPLCKKSILNSGETRSINQLNAAQDPLQAIRRTMGTSGDQNSPSPSTSTGTGAVATGATGATGTDTGAAGTGNGNGNGNDSELSTSGSPQNGNSDDGTAIENNGTNQQAGQQNGDIEQNAGTTADGDPSNSDNDNNNASRNLDNTPAAASTLYQRRTREQEQQASIWGLCREIFFSASPFQLSEDTIRVVQSNTFYEFLFSCKGVSLTLFLLLVVALFVSTIVFLFSLAI